MKSLFASLVLAVAPSLVLAQAPAAQPAKPAASPAAKAAAKPVRPAAKPRVNPELQQAVEVNTPLEDPDPNVKLSEADLAVAKRVYIGEIPCELGAAVKVTPFRREGFFLVSTGRNRFVMHPVESRTGAIRLEDPKNGGMWLQLANKSMLMNQRVGKRLADECASPEQAAVGEELKKNPINILEPAPAAAPASAVPAAAGSAPRTN
jgi:hypothetical protein